MNKNPVVGMKDILPNEMDIRNFLISKIRDVYKRFGFTEIATPIIEHIENLNGDLGWENEKLIFKILKRGDKLAESLKSGNLNDIIDFGMRYDLTLPLCRFYANNKDNLPKPFKAIQIGNVFRADRPQKGRYRQFTQCDLDILGDSTNVGEIEVLLATITLLNEIKFDKYKFSIDINDRKLLKAIFKYAGFSDSKETFDNVCITLDKLDKIGIDGVKNELISSEYSIDSVEKFLSLFTNYMNADNSLDNQSANKLSIDNIKDFSNKLSGILEDNVAENLIEIINIVTKNIDVKINFNPTLVRGMGYYTGPIIEIKSEMFNGSVGGGGRYDEMIGKFCNIDTPAIGLSLGFERIINLYMDDNFQISNQTNKIAYLLENGLGIEKKNNAIKEASIDRKNGNIVYVAEMSKNKKFQKENLANIGYTIFKDFYNN